MIRGDANGDAPDWSDDDEEKSVVGVKVFQV